VQKQNEKAQIVGELALVLGVITLTSGVLVALAASNCQHQEADYNNQKKPCMTSDCLTNTNNGQTCTYSSADQLVFCNCGGSNNCQATYAKAKNFILEGWEGKCGSLGLCDQGIKQTSYSTNNEATIMESVGCP
jgi:hypothetical protein